MNEQQKNDKNSVSILSIMADVQLEKERQELAIASLLCHFIKNWRWDDLSSEQQFKQAVVAARIIIGNIK